MKVLQTIFNLSFNEVKRSFYKGLRTRSWNNCLHIPVCRNILLFWSKSFFKCRNFPLLSVPFLIKNKSDIFKIKFFFVGMEKRDDILLACGQSTLGDLRQNRIMGNKIFMIKVSGLLLLSVFLASYFFTVTEFALQIVLLVGLAFALLDIITKTQERQVLCEGAIFSPLSLSERDLFHIYFQKKSCQLQQNQQWRN